jgi:hypothetical protein
MEFQQIVYRDSSWDSLNQTADFHSNEAQLVLAFGERLGLESYDAHSFLKAAYPHAEIVINTTAGEIYENSVFENSIIATAIQFEHTYVRTVLYSIGKHQESEIIGDRIGRDLVSDDLAAVLIISDGSYVNGSALLSSLNSHIKPTIPILGGLAADNTRFEKTLVGLNQRPGPGNIVGIGLYGEKLKVGSGAGGGWEVFGPERQVTRSEYNVLYSIDGKAVLDLYKEYLGRYASELPAAALHFPLSMRVSVDSETVVRTILSIDEETKSMTFAGEIPHGAWVRLMKANNDRLIEASLSAVTNAREQLKSKPELALLVSCVGRKLALGMRVEEEVETVRKLLGPGPVITGFYSYGEISQLHTGSPCELNNQTITVTVFSER